MSLGLKWGSQDNPDDPSGFIYFDAVTLYTQQYKGQVTKHPIDNGASVTDHFIKENDIYTITGVISGVDLSNIPFNIRDQEGNVILNAREQPLSVSLNDSSNGLLQYIPDSIGQFFSVGLPEPIVDQNSRTDLTFEILSKDLIKGLLKGVKYNSNAGRFESYIQLVELYEFDGSNIRDIIDSLVLIDFKINEDADSGDGLFFEMVLERVTFALLEKVQLPPDVQNSLKKNKGKQNSTNEDVDSNSASSPKTDSDRLKEIEQGTVNTQDYGIGKPLYTGSLE